MAATRNRLGQLRQTAEGRAQAQILSGDALELARAWARARALDHAVLLADLTQLAPHSLAAGVLDGSTVRGLACCYTGLPFLAVALWAEAAEVTHALLRALAAHQPRLRAEPAYVVLSLPTYKHLQAVTVVEEAIHEVKRVYSVAEAAPPSAAAQYWRPVPLGPQDLPALTNLYDSVPAVAWTPLSLSYGPARGIYVGGQLAAAAGVHYHTPWVTEIGHIVTRPEQRRRGMAEAVVRALLADLQGHTRHIFLMHVTANRAAARLYARLGFAPYTRMLLVRFRLHF